MNNEEKILALLEQMNSRLDTLEQGQADIKSDMKERFGQVDTRLDQMDTRLDQMDVRFDQVDTRLDQMDVRFDKVDARFDKVDARFDRLEFQAKELWKDVDTALEKIDEHEKNFHTAG
ncbi:MAG: hypothetical protein HFJ80_06490 [Clostridiales bacterium]|nr:hypothetical protein [Clostridiales bacterium]